MLSLSGLSLAFGERQLLSGLELRLNSGELCWLQGANGSGKSSLLNAISGIIPEHIKARFSGSISLSGIDFTQQPLCEKFHWLWHAQSEPETQFFFPTCEAELAFALENQGVPAAEINRRIEASLEQFQLESCRDKSPLNLSQGQQKLLLCAIGCALDPQLYLLDEPLAGLSESSQKLVLNWLKAEKSRGKIILVAEHNPALQQLSDHTLQLTKTDSFATPENASQTAALQFLTPQPVSSVSLPEATKPEILIQTRNLSFAYPRSGQLFSGLNIAVPSTARILIRGENGSGKSTLLKLLAGLLRAQSGSVRLAGRELNSIDPTAFDHLYYQGQSTSDNLLGISPRQNWQFWKLALPSLPDSPWTADPLFSELSAGQSKQAALSILPWLLDKFWLLDEPFAALDASSTAWLKQLLTTKSLHHPGMIVVSHSADGMAELFDEVWTLENGCPSREARS